MYRKFLPTLWCNVKVHFCIKYKEKCSYTCSCTTSKAVTQNIGIHHVNPTYLVFTMAGNIGQRSCDVINSLIILHCEHISFVGRYSPQFRDGSKHADADRVNGNILLSEKLSLFNGCCKVVTLAWNNQTSFLDKMNYMGSLTTMRITFFSMLVA